MIGSVATADLNGCYGLSKIIRADLSHPRKSAVPDIPNVACSDLDFPRVNAAPVPYQWTTRRRRGSQLDRRYDLSACPTQFLRHGVRANFDHAQEFLRLLFAQFFDFLEARRLRGFVRVFGSRVQCQQIEIRRVMIRIDLQRAPQEFSSLFVLSSHQITLPKFG